VTSYEISLNEEQNQTEIIYPPSEIDEKLSTTLIAGWPFSSTYRLIPCTYHNLTIKPKIMGEKFSRYHFKTILYQGYPFTSGVKLQFPKLAC